MEIVYHVQYYRSISELKNSIEYLNGVVGDIKIYNIPGHFTRAIQVKNTDQVKICPLESELQKRNIKYSRPIFYY